MLHYILLILSVAVSLILFAVWWSTRNKMQLYKGGILRLAQHVLQPSDKQKQTHLFVHHHTVNNLVETVQKTHSEHVELLKKQENDLELLGELKKELVTNLSQAKIIRTLHNHIRKFMPASVIAIATANKENTGLNLWGIKDEDLAVTKGFEPLHDENRWLVYCFNSQTEVFVNDYTPKRYSHYFSNVLGGTDSLRQSFIYIPLTLSNNRIGVLTVQSYQADAYTAYHQSVLRNLAIYITIALQNAISFEQLEYQKESLEKQANEILIAKAALEQTVADRTAELMQQKEDLQRTNQELSLLSIVARETDNAIMIMDATGNILWINDCFTRIYEYTYDEFIARRGRNILQTSFNPSIKQTIEECIANKKPVIYEALNVMKNGDSIWTQTTLTPIVNAEGNITNLVTIDSDITTLKQAKEEITKQHEKIQAQSERLELINNELQMLSIVARETDNAIMIMDALGNILWINDCFTKIYEYTYNEFIAIRGNNILKTSFNPQIIDTIHHCINQRKAVSYSALNVTRSGKSLWVQTTLTPILNPQGEITHLVTIDTDISRLKAAEEQISQQKKSITDSITYAGRIQNAILPLQTAFEQAFSQHFIIYKPKDIVSGDFYWLKKIGRKIILAAADCTGHGVPGAFMSMLGTAFMTEIVNKYFADESQYVATPADILDALRDHIIESLRQNGNRDDAKDGMDIALCIIDTNTNILQYSGAHIPLCIGRKQRATSVKTLEDGVRINTYTSAKQDMVLYSVAPDKMPIGYFHTHTKPFNNRTIQLLPSDRIYLFSDGFSDQHGGDKGRKFSSKSLKQLLIDSQYMTLVKQKGLIENTLKEWMTSPVRKIEQIDDIMLVGVQLQG